MGTLISGLSGLSRSLSAFSHDKLLGGVPMGYKSIVICERLAVVQDAATIVEWQKVDRVPENDKILGKYCIHSNQQLSSFVPGWNRNIESYSIRRSESDVSIYAHLWESYDEAIGYAKGRSYANELVFMVSRIIGFYNWH